MMAMRAVAPAAEEDEVMRSPPSQVVRKPCWTCCLSLSGFGVMVNFREGGSQQDRTALQ